MLKKSRRKSLVRPALFVSAATNISFELPGAKIPPLKSFTSGRIAFPSVHDFTVAAVFVEGFEPSKLTWSAVNLKDTLWVLGILAG